MIYPCNFIRILSLFSEFSGGRRGRDHLVNGFTNVLPVQLVPITTKLVSPNSAYDDVHSIQNYVCQ